MKTIQLPESLDLYQLINLIADALCPIETDDAEGIGYQLTRIDVEKEITQAARDGLLPLRHPMTLAPVSFHPAAVMLAKDLTPYLAARNLEAATVDSAITPPTMPEGAKQGPTWSVRRPLRDRGYNPPLYRFLVEAHREGRPRPKARDVLEAWRSNPPAEIAKMLADGFDYYNAEGDTESASLDAIRKAIKRMTTGR